MNVFYGVQGTGNGHLSRARLMAAAFQAAGIAVQFQFSGRVAEKYFDMDCFGDFQLREGLTFSTAQGQLNYWKTACQANLRNFYKEIKDLDLSGYDVILSDFEPITAWAAHRQKKPVLGIGNQYAYQYPIPKQGANFLAEQVLKYFAPVDNSVALHWHHFNQPILPPITEQMTAVAQTVPHKILVYLPFEDPRQVVDLLGKIDGFTFHCYCAEPVTSDFPQVICHRLSRENFRRDMRDCEGVISNAGFELASEALQLGKKLLVKPLHAQMEQLSNVAALVQLGYAQTMPELQPTVIAQWLASSQAVQVRFPNVAEILVQWIQDGMPPMTREFIAAVWEQVTVEHRNAH